MLLLHADIRQLHEVTVHRSVHRSAAMRALRGALTHPLPHYIAMTHMQRRSNLHCTVEIVLVVSQQGTKSQRGREVYRYRLL